MSVDEDNELRELVSQTLESNGILAKIRAELRASVFLALEEQDAFKDKPHLLNKALKDFVSTSEGTIVMCLIREFLEFFGLEFTMAVFDPETQLGQDYEYVGRNKLAKDLKIKTVKKNTPLLVQVVQSVCDTNGSDEFDFAQKRAKLQLERLEGKKQPGTALTNVALCLPDLSSHNGNSPKEDIVKLEEKADTKSQPSGNTLASGVLKNDSLISSPKNIIALNGSLKQTDNLKEQILDNKQLNEIKSTTVQQSIVPQPNIRKPDSLKLDISPSNVKSVSNSSLSSLGGLPPLAQLANGQVQLGKPLFGQKDVTNDIKALLDQGLNDSQDNNYEEDFHSSTSDKTRKGQVSASGSEIEEEISSAGDDQTSISGGGDENTVDTTISQLSGHGDYVENI